MQIHHESYEHLGIPRLEVKDVILLCPHCHYEKHFGNGQREQIKETQQYAHLFDKPKESLPDYASLLAIGLEVQLKFNREKAQAFMLNYPVMSEQPFKDIYISKERQPGEEE